MVQKIRVIRPSSLENGNFLEDRIRYLENMGFEILYQPLESDPNWIYTSGSIFDRAKSLENALCESESDLVWCARGGYGASDLLPELNWDRISNSPEKLIVGFSDISAIHAALYKKCQWKSLHAPMLATNLWGQNGERDIDEALMIVRGEAQVINRVVENPYNEGVSIEGNLFGGCFSVLTNLIGTAYFPELEDHILYFEDIGENPARILRYLNQWIQSGSLNGVQAIVLGVFRDLGENIEDSASYFIDEFSKRIGVPVWVSSEFGHISPNYPLLNGARARLSGNELRYWVD